MQSQEPQTAAQGDGERRHLTLLFCDITGSTRLAGSMDPEDWRNIVARFNALCARSAADYGGFLARKKGDSILAYFGWPQGLERAAEGAVHCALKIQAGFDSISWKAGKTKKSLSARIGIHAGEVVIDDAGEVYGDAANVAARTEAAAEPGRVLVTAEIRRLAARAFHFRDLGEYALKGVTQRVRMYEPSAERRRAPLRASPLVGRQDELAELLDVWRWARSGSAQRLALTGPPGIGKSRLIRALKQATSGERRIWIQVSGSPFLTQKPFGAVREALRTYALATPFRKGTPETLLQLRAPEAQGAVAGRQTSEADVTEDLSRAVCALAARNPIILVVEDAHWLDAASMEALTHIADSVRTEPILILAAYRSNTPVPLDRSGFRVLTLPELTGDDIRAVAVSASDGAMLSEEMWASIAQRSNGVPLFAEELTHLTLRDPGKAASSIPDTLADTLTARLDQLKDLKPAVQLAAVLGMHARLDILAALMPSMPKDLAAHLEDARITVTQTHGQHTMLAFRHALLRDAAYQSLLKAQRREIHKRVAQTLERAFVQDAAAFPETLARHWMLAGDLTHAVPYWLEAAGRAVKQGHFRVARAIYEDALAAVDQEGAGKHMDAELAMRGGLAHVLQITVGYSAVRTIAANKKALELASRLASPAKPSRILREWASLSSAGKYRQAMVRARELWAAAKEAAVPARLAEAHMAMMTAHFRLGQLPEAEDFFASGERFFGDDAFQKSAGVIPQTYGNAARLAWLTGRPAECKRREAIVRAHADSGTAYDKAFALCMAASQSVLDDDFVHAYDFAERASAIVAEHEFPQFAAIADVCAGRALAARGRVADGIERLERGLEAMTKANMRVARTVYMTWRLQTELEAGGLEAAGAICHKLFRTNASERYFLPEMIRVRGELRRKLGQIGPALRDFERAADTARIIGASVLEARAQSAWQELARLRSAL